MSTPITTDFKSFTYLENGEIAYSMIDAKKCTKVLDPGIYSLCMERYPSSHIVLKQVQLNQTITLNNFENKEVLDQFFVNFFKPEVKQKVEELGMIHSNGIMFYGQEGTGKSTIIRNYLSKFSKEEGAVSFYVNHSEGLTEQIEFIKSIRKIQENPIIVIMEEFEGCLRYYESFVKTFMDGNNTIDNCIIFATTNEIESIPKSVKNRPSRIKYCMEVGVINDIQNIEDIIKGMIKDIPKEDVQKMSKNFLGATLDQIKEHCLNLLFGNKVLENSNNKIGFK